MISQMRRIIRFDMIHAAYWEDQLVGFIVNIPDLNWALRKAKGQLGLAENDSTGLLDQKDSAYASHCPRRT